MGHSPLPRPLPSGEGDTSSPHPTSLGVSGASILAPAAYTAPFCFQKTLTVRPTLSSASSGMDWCLAMGLTAEYISEPDKQIGLMITRFSRVLHHWAP